MKVSFIFGLENSVASCEGIMRENRNLQRKGSFFLIFHVFRLEAHERLRPLLDAVFWKMVI